MKPKTNALAEAPSATDEAGVLVAQLQADIAKLESEIAEAERQRDAKALELSDDEFEAHVLDTERKKRSLLRLQKQLEAAETQLMETEKRNDNKRRQSLYEAGEAACREAEALIKGDYKIHAAALARVLGRLDELYGVVKAANDNMPNGKNPRDHTIDVDAFRHEADTPASTHTEVETYFVDDAQQPRSGFDVRKFNAATTLVAKTREKVVHVRGWKGTKMSPLTWGVKLPAVTYDGPAFWPVRAN